ncbi:MAG: SHOCT domain-containing protein [Solirubrobacteraceae bacterium]
MKGAQRRSEPADPTERLAKLQALKESGVLTEAEYEGQRQKIIDAI